MTDNLLRLKGVLIAIVALALSASLAFGAQAPAGFAAGGSFADTSEPTETAGDEELTEDEDADEDTDELTEDVEAAEAADNCLTDPTTVTPEELAEMTHGSIVCWAAHQETPEGYDNHGAWVREWAHFGKDGGNPAATKSNGKAKGQANRP